MGLEENEGRAKAGFSQTASTREHDETGDAIEVPEMIKQDHPELRPAPPALGAEVDAQAFDERWRAEQRRAQPTELDPFDQVDRQAGLQNDFNRGADVIGHAQAQLNAADDRLADSVDEYLANHDHGWHQPAGIIDRIEIQAHEAYQREEELDAMTYTGQELEPELDLGDAFEQVDRQAEVGVEHGGFER